MRHSPSGQLERSHRPPESLPRALVDGARIALVAPAGPVGPDRIEASCERCRTLGLEPVVFPAARDRDGFLAGPDVTRLADLQSAFDDPSVDGIWALRGGYGTLRILDALDLRRQRRDPIPFIGFSDNTTLHVRHAAMGVVSFHGPHPGGAFPEPTEASFRAALFRDEAPGPLPRGGDDAPSRTLVPGRVEAPLWGGNLALLAAMCGSHDELTAAGRILFMEEVSEPPYRVDRMMLQLKRAGALRGVAGLALGRFSGVGGTAADADALMGVLEEWADRLAVPAVADLPFGHVDHNCTLPVGGRAILDADQGELVLSNPAVRKA